MDTDKGRLTSESVGDRLCIENFRACEEPVLLQSTLTNNKKKKISCNIYLSLSQDTQQS